MMNTQTKVPLAKRDMKVKITSLDDEFFFLTNLSPIGMADFSPSMKMIRKASYCRLQKKYDLPGSIFPASFMRKTVWRIDVKRQVIGCYLNSR